MTDENRTLNKKKNILIFHYGNKYFIKVQLFPQALYEREEEEMNDGNKTLNIKQETQNKLISRYGKYSMKV